MPDESELAVIVSCPDVDAGTLRAAARVAVVDVTERARIAPNHVFVLPEQRGVRFDGGELVIEHDRSPQAPIDAIMRTMVDEVGRGVVGVLLSGRGTEGTLGIKHIKEAGGLTIAQRIEGDHAAMPDAAIATGLVDLVLRVDDMPAQILAVPPGDERRFDALDEPRSGDGDGDTLRDILTLVRVRTGHDFGSYKRATLFRRIARRTQVCGCDAIGAYHVYLREHPQELQNLLRDFLISVTSFFRDPRAYEALARDAIPKLFSNRTITDHVRVWVAGCATGEEAYSLAILLLEHASALAAPPHIQVFATDIDENALAEARQGWYPESVAVDISQERLARFFVRENGRLRVAKEVRELVLFSTHNLLRDPPFSRLDLITCRNLLIYLDRSAQDHVLTMFHFGLRPDGILFLGSSESAEGSRIFTTLDPKHRLFARRSPAPQGNALGSGIHARTRWNPQRTRPLVFAPPERATPVGELHHRIVEQYAPPSVLVNGELQIEHLSAHVGRYLEHAGGEPTRELLQLVKPALQLELRSAIYRARHEGSDRRVVRFEDGGKARAVEIRARAVEATELGHGALLVFFDDVAPDDGDRSDASNGTEVEPVVREIEAELQRTREQLHTTVDQYETSLEELKASNEELQTINEELRSATEELETSKEELQSVNEELATLNRELKLTVDQASTASSDAQNLMTSTQIGVVFLDRELNIKRFTPRAQDLFHIIPSDVGRPLTDLTHRLEDADLAATARSVLDTLRTVEREVRSRDHKWYLVRWLPYRSIDDRIEGVVITFVDVNELREAVEARRRSEVALHQAEERLRQALRVAPVAIIAFGPDAVATWAYVGGRELPDASAFAPIFAPGHGERLEAAARDVKATLVGKRLELDVVADGVSRTFDFRIEPNSLGVTAVGFDITPSKMAEASLREADRRKDEFLATLSHELRNPLAPLKIAIDVARLVDGDPAKRAHSLSVMERQVAMLSELVDELLDLSRITQGKIEFDRTTVELSRVIDAALEATRAMFAAANHELRMHVPGQPVYLDGDQRRLVQIFTNLLANAAKYTPAGGHIDVDITVERDRGRVHVRVTDDGVGIAPELLGNIFDIFVQSRDARGRSQGGLGIGLSVVRKLVEMHGGEVEVTSPGIGKGSTFIVHLPIRKEL
ncbi:MAG: PAS domain-containing protein [Deltaproteobacteria bacterium]|nr:PAS domain-containing protein [Deltaproteobacteria bacterium]